MAGPEPGEGLPAYLLRDPSIRVRTKDDARYMQAVQRYMDAVGPKIAPLMANRGGPILMMQIENEYASFGHDLGYLELLRTMWRERGIDAHPIANRERFNWRM